MRRARVSAPAVEAIDSAGSNASLPPINAKQVAYENVRFEAASRGAETAEMGALLPSLLKTRYARSPPVAAIQTDPLRNIQVLVMIVGLCTSLDRFIFRAEADVRRPRLRTSGEDEPS